VRGLTKIDNDVIQEMLDGKTYVTDSGNLPENWVKQIPPAPSGTPYPDVDFDGMPDAFEDTHGLDKSDANDAFLVKKTYVSYFCGVRCINE
jgi:hypothetical protein